jgi:hypothetical protein
MTLESQPGIVNNRLKQAVIPTQEESRVLTSGLLPQHQHARFLLRRNDGLFA